MKNHCKHPAAANDNEPRLTNRAQPDNLAGDCAPKTLRPLGRQRAARAASRPLNLANAADRMREMMERFDAIIDVLLTEAETDPADQCGVVAAKQVASLAYQYGRLAQCLGRLEHQLERRHA